MNITNILTQRNITVDGYIANKCDIPKPIVTLSSMIADNYSKCSSFIKYIRNAYSQKQTNCSFTFGQVSDEERAVTLSIVNKMKENGILTNLYIEDNRLIHGNFSRNPRINAFITGDFLEIYAAAKTYSVVSEKAAKYHKDFEIINNVILHGKNEKHELDSLIRIDDKLFWLEVKSGNVSSFDKYYEIGKWLKVNPNMHILLTLDHPMESCYALSYFYTYYICNISNYHAILSNMIDQAFQSCNPVSA